MQDLATFQRPNVARGREGRGVALRGRLSVPSDENTPANRAQPSTLRGEVDRGSPGGRIVRQAGGLHGVAGADLAALAVDPPGRMGGAFIAWDTLASGVVEHFCRVKRDCRRERRRLRLDGLASPRRWGRSTAVDASALSRRSDEGAVFVAQAATGQPDAAPVA